MLSLEDGGPAGVMAHKGPNLIFLGNAPAHDPNTGLAVPLSGLLLKQGTETKQLLNAAPSK